MTDFLLVVDTEHSVFVPQTERARLIGRSRVSSDQVVLAGEIASLLDAGFTLDIADERG